MGEKMVDVIKFLSKSLLSVIKLGIICGRGWIIESKYPEICIVNVLYVDTVGLYGGHMCRLVALSISCVVVLSCRLCVFNGFGGHKVYEIM